MRQVAVWIYVKFYIFSEIMENGGLNSTFTLKIMKNGGGGGGSQIAKCVKFPQMGASKFYNFVKKKKKRGGGLNSTASWKGCGFHSLPTKSAIWSHRNNARYFERRDDILIHVDCLYVYIVQPELGFGIFNLNIRGNIKAPYYWPYLVEIHGDRFSLLVAEVSFLTNNRLSGGMRHVVTEVTSLLWSVLLHFWPVWRPMITSSDGNIFRVTGHLCGEFTGHRWIPCTKASDAELWCFLWSAPQ